MNKILTGRNGKLKILLWIKRRLNILKLVMPLLIISLILFLRHNDIYIYTLIIGLSILMLNIIFPVIGDIVDKILIIIINILRIIITLIFTLIIQGIIFPIIKIISLIFGKRFLILKFKENRETYYINKPDIIDDINEPY